MTKKEIATLSFKILSLYAFFHLIDKLAHIISYLLYGDLSGVKFLNFISWAVPPFLFLIFGILLWYAASPLAASLFKTTDPDDKANASLIDIQTVAFSVVGLFVLADSVPDFLRVVVWHYSVESTTPIQKSPLAGDGVAFLLRSAAGFWLLLGSRGIVNLVRRLRRE
jgi:hypothetical protein